MQKTTIPATVITPELDTNDKGHLTFGGLDTTDLVNKYGSPLFLISENTVRANCRRHREYLHKYIGEESIAAYASKALSCKAIYRIVGDEGMYADAVSVGELYTAISAGFHAGHLIFHGNNKTESDITYAIHNHVGFIVADNMTELENISRIAVSNGSVQNILIRITPGIDPHTHEKINTGKIDSKFGLPIATGQASEAVGYALSLPGIKLLGVHYHIGSQITDATPFADALENTLDFLGNMRGHYGFVAEYINIGGGFGIRYTEDAPKTDYDAIFGSLARKLNVFCDVNDYPHPTIITEPGRSIVADAGITLYTVGGVKSIPGYKSYVSVDGGMTDNPRFALYGAPYTALLADRAEDRPDFRCCIAGRCCESGDIIIPEALLPRPEVGNILAVLNTGAYNYSMSSNYNRIPRPPIVIIADGCDYVAVKRESLENLIALDN